MSDEKCYRCGTIILGGDVSQFRWRSIEKDRAYVTDWHSLCSSCAKEVKRWFEKEKTECQNCKSWVEDPSGDGSGYRDDLELQTEYDWQCKEYCKK